MQRIHLIRLAGGEPDEVDKPSHGYGTKNLLEEDGCEILQNDEFVPIFQNPKATVVNKKAEEILGLTYDQFCQVVIAWQVEQLENMQWIDEGQNLVIIGKCDTGKTTLAAHIGQIALRKKR